MKSGLTKAALMALSRRGLLLGAGALAIFTALTIPLVHHFWTMQGPEAMVHFFFVAEHVSLIGGLMLVAILSRHSTAAVAEGTRLYAKA